MTHAPHPTSRWAQVAAAALLIVTGLRVLVAALPVFGWSVDPRASDVPSIGLGITATALLSSAALIILTFTLVNHVRQNKPVHVVAIGLWALGTIFGLIHGLHDAQSMRIGLDWSAAIATALAAWHLSEQLPIRRFLIAATVALIIPLSLQAGYQVFVEQPRLVEFYEQHRTDIAKQQRWSDETQDQRKYEARLYQTEARGRFEFSNVFGSVIAVLTMLAVALALTVQKIPLKQPWMKHALPGLALVGAGTLFLTFSKGAIGAMALTCGATAVAFWLSKRRWSPRWVGALWLLVILGVIGAVLVRGAIGAPETAEGERSLLFRYHYWQGATRAWIQSPITGMGPGTFRDAYLIHKNPISPEDVTDPHGLTVAWISTLGLGGIAWIGLCFWMLVAAAVSIFKSEANSNEVSPEERRSIRIWILITTAVLFFAQYAIEMPRYWIDDAVLWLMGAVGFAALTYATTTNHWADSRVMRFGLAAAALVAVAHGQIEMSLTHTMAAPLLWMILGIAAAQQPAAVTTPRGASIAAAGLAGAITLGALGLGVIPFMRHQSHLNLAAQQLRHGDPHGAVQQLEQASASLPTLPWPLEQAAILEIEMAQQIRQPETRDALIASALAHLERGRAIGVQQAGLWNTEAQLRERVATLTGDPQQTIKAAEAAEAALRLQPHDLYAHLFAAERVDAAGQRDRAMALYQSTLKLSEQAYLDPLKPLTKAQIQKINRRIALLAQKPAS